MAKEKVQPNLVAIVDNEDITCVLYKGDNGAPQPGIYAEISIKLQDTNESVSATLHVPTVLTAAEKTAFYAALVKLRDQALDDLGFIDT